MTSRESVSTVGEMTTRFCTGTFFLASQRELEETKPLIIYHLILFSILHPSLTDWTRLFLKALLPLNFYALLKSPSLIDMFQ